MGTDYVFLFVVLPSFCLAYFAARSLEVLFHELGHAIPALIFTKNNVSIYLGSYAETAKSKKISFKRLTIYYNSIFRLWKYGACMHRTENLNYKKYLVIVLSGPLFSLMLAGLIFYLAIATDAHGAVKFLLFMLLITAVFDLRGLIPTRNHSHSAEGRLIYNDGDLIKRLLLVRDNYNDLQHLFELYSQARYQDYIDYFESINLKYVDIDVYRTTVYSYMQINEYEKAKTYSNQYLKKLPHSRLTSYDYCNEGIIESQLGHPDKALIFYNMSLQLDPNNIHALNNRGFTLGLLERHYKAITDLDRTIELSADFAYAYNNRGYSKLKLNLIEEGLQDIKRSLSMDDQNPYAYRNLGIYHLEQNNIHEALFNFEKAKELDPKTYQIDDLIYNAKYRLAPAV